MLFAMPSTRTSRETPGAGGRFVNSCTGRKFTVGQVRLEPGIPKLLVKINPTDAESFHARATVFATFQHFGSCATTDRHLVHALSGLSQWLDLGSACATTACFPALLLMRGIVFEGFWRFSARGIRLTLKAKNLGEVILRKGITSRSQA